ncbi:MAG: alpha/beta hydrolase, partial [Phycisphaerae bacterium]
SIVWPTERRPHRAARFTTEALIDAVIADVAGRVKVDRGRVFVFGWSSGGPACYAAALRERSPVAGAFVAMSVFKPKGLPSLDRARGKAFYLLQSPDDRVTALRWAVAAEKALRKAGATVKLTKYAGGHGWRGDVWGMIRSGVEWLESNAGRGP